MTLNLSDNLPPWAMLPVLAVHMAGGIGLGALYFHALWRNTRQIAEGASVAVIIGWMVGRFALLAVVLVPVSFEGALPLVATALGIVTARFITVRRVQRQETPA